MSRGLFRRCAAVVRVLRVLRVARVARVLPVAAVAVLIAAGCDTGKLVTLGNKPPTAPRFDPPRPIPELNPGAKNDNPTLTGDLLEIFFTSDRDAGNSDVWTAQRGAATDPFGPAVRVEIVSGTLTFESSSAISLDGLTLWFGSDRPGGAGDLDAWAATRGAPGSAWSTPVNVVALNSMFREIPRPPGMGGLVMPLGTTRPGDDFLYRTYFATRAATDGSFGVPTLVSELNFPDRSTVDGFLTADGLTLFYSSSELVGPSDLYVALRTTTSAPFTVIQPLTDLNTASDDRDPWLSPDGTRFFFASDRSGILALYEATVRAP